MYIWLIASFISLLVFIGGTIFAVEEGSFFVGATSFIALLSCLAFIGEFAMAIDEDNCNIEADIMNVDHEWKRANIYSTGCFVDVNGQFIDINKVRVDATGRLTAD